VAAVALRLVTLPLAPLADQTEARYAEIARLMLTLGDWVTPHISPDQPFWGKPPLATWAHAAAMSLFGISAGAARLGSLAWALAGLGAFAWLLRGTAQRPVMLVAWWLTPLAFISAGAVMTDATLAACVLAVQAAWWQAVQAVDAPGRRRAGRLMAVALALALLCKGPAAGVLALLPVALHAAWRRHGGVLATLLRDPLAWGLLLVLALPWYVWAEWRSPGFLQYFLLGEHVMRFIQPGWQGDRYGFAHAQPLGAIVVFVLVASAPLSLAALLRWVWRRGGVVADVRTVLPGDLLALAVCIVAGPLLLFGAARNIIWTYAGTALPGVVMLGCAAFGTATLARPRALGVAAVLVVLYAAAFGWVVPRLAEGYSDRGLVAAWQAACPDGGCPLAYAGRPTYSAQFYTQGALYARPQPGPGFTVRQRRELHGASALACNRARCLVHD